MCAPFCTLQAYRPCPVRFEFGDGCDRTFLKTFLARTGLCASAAVIFDGGVNHGQLIDTMRSVGVPTRSACFSFPHSDTTRPIYAPGPPCQV